MIDNKKVSLREVFVYTKSLVAEVLQVKESDVKLDKSLMKELGADSLDIIAILCELEKKFHIDFDRAVDSHEMQTIPDSIRNQYFVYDSDSLTLRKIVASLMSIIRAKELKNMKQQLLKQNLGRSGRSGR